ncbi:MAG: hypothetical protein ACRCYU_24435, partial [Nocardioides sp.]
MEIAQNIVLLAHFMGWAALFGGMLAQSRNAEKLVNGPMRDGIGTAFLTGLALVGFLEAGDDPVNHAKVAVKLAVGVAITVLVMVNLRKSRISDNLFWAILGLTVVNMA